ncbi:19081_t:CDS:2, partial [Racocetra persica]
MRSRKLTDKEKAEIREELKGVNMKADEILKEQKLSELDPSTIPQFYKHFYEQGKMLIRARTKASVNRTKEELRHKWYNQAKKDIMPKYESKGKWPRNRNFLPEKIKGKKVSGYPPPDATFNFFLDVNNMNRSSGKELIVLFQKPFQVNYIGYDGFLTSEDKKNTEEGELFGITDYGKLEGDEWNDGTSYRAWGKDEKGARFYDDICFEALADTIAHELAHAIVATFEFKYEGEEEGGHGKLFYDICKEIEEM